MSGKVEMVFLKRNPNNIMQIWINFSPGVSKYNKIRDLFKVKLRTIRSETKKERERERKKEREKK